MADNQIYLSPKVAGAVIEDYVQHLGTSPSAAGNATLSAREREVLQLIVEGKTTPDIAAALNVSEKTIGTHRQHIMEKLDIGQVPFSVETCTGSVGCVSPSSRAV